MQTTLTLATAPNAAAVRSAPAHSDEHLMLGIAAGDRHAMELLYVRHHVRVYRFILRLVQNAATAEDLTSVVFLEVWKQAGGFERRAQVSTWMLAIARNKALSALRGRTLDQVDDAVLNAIPDGADDPERALEKQMVANALQQCLTELSPAHREVIDLVYYHSRSIAEVAEITGVALNTVKTRMFHARKRLATLLAAHEFDTAA